MEDIQTSRYKASDGFRLRMTHLPTKITVEVPDPAYESLSKVSHEAIEKLKLLVEPTEKMKGNL